MENLSFMIEIIKEGDLFEVQGNIGHGVNCSGVMGKGIALEFKRRYPEMFKSYRDLCLSGKFGPGDVFAWQDPITQRWILNLGTQKTWREKAKPEYLKESLEKTINFIGETKITFPRICAGLGGMDWEEVKSIFFSIDSPRVHIYLIENSAQKT